MTAPQFRVAAVAVTFVCRLFVVVHTTALSTSFHDFFVLRFIEPSSSPISCSLNSYRLSTQSAFSCGPAVHPSVLISNHSHKGKLQQDIMAEYEVIHAAPSLVIPATVSMTTSSEGIFRLALPTISIVA
jgi:hypothetical protein